MLRTMLVNPVVIAVVVAAGVACCRLGGINPHGAEAAVAAGIALAASLLGGVVLLAGRSQPHTATGPAVSALLAMVAHLGFTLLGSIFVLLATGTAPVPFAYWMLGLFWATLLGLAAVCVRSVRTATPLPPVAVPPTAG